MAEEDVVDNGGEQVEKPQLTEAEKKAKELGWVPQDEYKGDPEQFRDAETFLKRGEEVIGFVRKDLERATSKNAKYEREIQELRETMEEFRKFHNESISQTYKRAVEDLRAEKITAIEQGDGSKVVEIDEKIEQLKEAQKAPEKKEEKKQTSPIIFTPQELKEWNSKNDWYGKDEEMSVFADDIADVLLVKEPDLKGAEFLDKLTRKVKAAYPDAFENPNRNNSTVSASGENRPSSGSKKKSYDSLPADAKAACDKFVKQKIMTREEYVRDYAWDN